MLITKSEDATKKVSVKYSEENSVFGRVSYYICLLEFLWEGLGWGGRLFEAGRLLTFSAFSIGAYSNKYGIQGFDNNGKENTKLKI